MDFKQFGLAMSLFIAGSANAATIFAPTDGTVNFLNSTIDFSGGTTLVAMFNVGDLGGINNAVVMNSSYASSVAVFSGSNPTGVDVKPSALSVTVYDSMSLSGIGNFILGLSTDSGANWVTDNGVTYQGADIYNVHFTDGTILEIDVRVVPVPAAAWLLGTGLIGLVGIARRRAAG